MRGLTFPEKQILSAARAESPVPQAASCGEPIGVQFAWSGVLVGELLQSLFSSVSSSSSSGCCLGYPELQASQSRVVLGEAGYLSDGLGVEGQLEEHSPTLPPLSLCAFAWTPVSTQRTGSRHAIDLSLVTGQCGSILAGIKSP